MAATTISNSISTGVTLGTGTYGSPLTITSTGTVALATGFYGVFADNAYGSATSVAPPPASSPRSLMAHTLGATTDSPSPASTGLAGHFRSLLMAMRDLAMGRVTSPRRTHFPVQARDARSGSAACQG